jgi:ribonuclease PH
MLDLDYPEDSTAEVDANVVMTGEGGMVEVQATAERTPLSRAHLDELLALAASGIEQLREAQERAIESASPAAGSASPAAGDGGSGSGSGSGSASAGS